MLKHYRSLGRSGLKVSPFCLGTMTSGNTAWGADDASARALFDRYVDAGGNFVDTADLYAGGKSEELLGQFVAERSLRDRMVIATKFSYNAEPGNPNSGGNGRKNILRALEGSLRRLKTDYIDLYWLHTWDMVTPPEEVMHTLDSAVRAGKVRYIGLSDVPAWYAARAQTLAELRGWEKVSALQFEYSLVERFIEHEFVPMARELGMGLTTWSPLALGLLTGKYRRDDVKAGAGGRLDVTRNSGNPIFQKFNERNWAIVDSLLEVARELDQPPSQVALNWLSQRPGVTSVLVGASSVAQLDSNLSSLDFEIPSALMARLDAASAPARPTPYSFFGPEIQGAINGGVPVSDWTRRWPA